MLTVRRAGPLTSLQDAGRHGAGALGIGRSGAADGPALRLANALVGNAADACALEMTLLGATLAFARDARVALTGAPLPRAQVDGRPAPMWRPFAVARGAHLDLGAMASGCRSYLAVDGGIDVPAWLGSRATDVNAALGPRPAPLTAGDTLPLGAPSALPAAEGPAWSLDPRPWFDTPVPQVVRLMRGRHTAALQPDALDALVGSDYTVARDSNRVGIRLNGAPLALRQPLELASEGNVAGVVQLPPDGQPIVLGCEHPVTGGYPRIGQVAAVDLPRLAQCRPGARVRFTWIDERDAADALAERDRALERLCTDIARRLETP